MAGTEWTEEGTNPTAWNRVVREAGFLLADDTSFLLTSDDKKIIYTVAE